MGYSATAARGCFCTPACVNEHVFRTLRYLVVCVSSWVPSLPQAVFCLHSCLGPHDMVSLARPFSDSFPCPGPASPDQVGGSSVPFSGLGPFFPSHYIRPPLDSHVRPVPLPSDPTDSQPPPSDPPLQCYRKTRMGPPQSTRSQAVLGGCNGQGVFSPQRGPTRA